MKVKLTSDWVDFGKTHRCGSVVDVSETDGQKLIEMGHILMHPDTPSRTSLDNYNIGCLPTPFSAQTSATYENKVSQIVKKK